MIIALDRWDRLSIIQSISIKSYPALALLSPGAVYVEFSDVKFIPDTDRISSD